MSIARIKSEIVINKTIFVANYCVFPINTKNKIKHRDPNKDKILQLI